MLVLAETEFWPNLLSSCFRREIPVAVVNARISDRSWPRYRRMRALWRPFLERISCVLAQSETDDLRLIAIGCDADRVSVAGNLKFDIRAAWEAEATRILKAFKLGNRLVVAGSTLEGEEAALLEAWPKLLEADPRLILVIAPRHPERFDAVAALLEQSGFSWERRTEWQDQGAGAIKPLRPGQIVLLDTIGELASVYSLASIAFVGGSLIPAGGHNPLEPAQFAVPIVIGPHYANFRDITEYLRDHQAIQIAEQPEFASVMIKLLEDSASARDMGERARQVFEQQSGATERCAVALRKLIGEEAPAAEAPNDVDAVPDFAAMTPVQMRPLVMQAKSVSLDPPPRMSVLDLDQIEPEFETQPGPVEQEPLQALPPTVEPAQQEPVEAEPVALAPVPEEAPEPEPVLAAPLIDPPIPTGPGPDAVPPSEAEAVQIEPTRPEPVAEIVPQPEPIQEEPIEPEPPAPEPAEELVDTPELMIPAEPELVEEPAAQPDPVEAEPAPYALNQPEPTLPEPVAEIVPQPEPIQEERIEEEPPAPDPVEELAHTPEATIPAEPEPVEEPAAQQEPVEAEPVSIAQVQEEPAQSEPVPAKSARPERKASLTVEKSGSSTRKFLLPLVPLYRLGQIMREKRTSGKAPVQLRHPVVSIGNLSTGGAGKTPLTIAMVAALAEHGFHVDVLSRGFGRTGQHPIRVATSGTAEEFGDEPLLIARATNAPVYVAAERYDAGLLAEGDAAAIAFLAEKMLPVVHLLDDGFQHRQLARAVDILLLDREDWTGYLLPAGNLREPLSAIRRANILAIPGDDPELERELRAWGWQGPVWRLRRQMSVTAIDGPVAAFCGIARPAQFFAGLEAAGVHLATRTAFPDHHPYTPKDLNRLVAAARSAGAIALVTTEKDQVRLGNLLGGIPGALPLKTVALRTEIEGYAEAMGSLTSQLKLAARSASL